MEMDSDEWEGGQSYYKDSNSLVNDSFSHHFYSRQRPMSVASNRVIDDYDYDYSGSEIYRVQSLADGSMYSGDAP